MSPVFLKGIGSLVALAGATAAGVGISHAYSGSSLDAEPSPVSESNDTPSSVPVVESKKVKDNSLPEEKRWLDLNKDGVEWGLKVDEYKNKNDLRKYGFKISSPKSGEAESTVKIRNITGMQKACEKLLEKDFSDDLFKVALDWCSVEKKIRWSEEQSGSKRALLLEGAEDESNWNKKIEDFGKENDSANKFELTEVKSEKLKEKCKEVGNLRSSSENKDKVTLFRRWCMIKKV